MMALWRWMQRRIDMQILWPQCKVLAPDLDHAKAAFAMHAFRDRAWVCLSDAEIVRHIDALE